MRTTISIRDDLYESIRRRAFEQRRHLGEVVNELIETGLRRSAIERPRILGAYSGQITVADDFDDELDDFADALNESVEP